MDRACGYAAPTLMEPNFRVLTVELEVNLLSVASGERLLARGQVIPPGRTVTVCRGDAYAGTGGDAPRGYDPHDDHRSGQEGVALVEHRRPRLV
jgi:acyl-coenzyme A thioesterase PaaI-like protein